jgi:hypothetical protein
MTIIDDLVARFSQTEGCFEQRFDTRLVRT